MKEIYRRLSERPQDIPDHVLGTFVAKLVSLIERKEQVVETAEFSLLDELDGLPRERAVELLVEETHRLGGVYDEHAGRLVTLVGEDRARELLRVERA